jgi:hypothetical protein
MSIRLLFAVFIFCINTVAAQRGKTYPVKVGEIPKEVLPNKAMYALPSFTRGTALLRNGTSSTQRFNYNFLLDEMHFIDATGDTLAVADPALIKSVVIDSMVFYYDNGYVREIFRTGIYKLAIKQQMVQVADKTRGAYDAASAASSIKTYGTINNYGQRYELQVKKDVLFQESISYYIGIEFNPFVKATRKNFHVFFAEKNITMFIKEHKINFNKEEDLKTLLQFCVE